MTKIFVFRHGQTTYNRDKIFTGQHAAELTEDGIKECGELAEQLKDVRPTKAYTSDLKRAQQTLYIALGSRKDEIPIVVDPRLKERSYGELEGRSKPEVEKEHPNEYKLWHRSYDVAPPGGESIHDVEKRVMPFLEEMLPTLKKEDVVFICAHGNSLRPIRKYFEHMSVEDMCSFEHTRGKIYEYEI